MPDAVAAAVFQGATLTSDGYTLGPGANGSSVQVGAEFVFPQSTSPWTEPRCAVASANSTHIAMLQPCWIDLYHKACGQGVKGTPVGGGGYVENAGVEFISSPGDFALDRASKTLHYALRPGEDASTLKAVMPVLEVLVNVTGAADIRFESLRFEHATWLRPGQANGYVESQTGACTVGPTPVPTDDYCNNGVLIAAVTVGLVVEICPLAESCLHLRLLLQTSYGLSNLQATLPSYRLSAWRSRSASLHVLVA